MMSVKPPPPLYTPINTYTHTTINDTKTGLAPPTAPPEPEIVITQRDQGAAPPPIDTSGQGALRVASGVGGSHVTQTHLA